MIVLSNLLIAIAQILNMILTIFIWLIIIRAVLSWVYPDPYHPVVQFFYRTTDPILIPVRRKLPPIGSIDISPFVVLMIIFLIQEVVVKSLFQYGYSLQ